MSVDKIREYGRRIEKHSEDRSVLKDTLHKLNKMEITIDILQKTGIGKVVNSIKRRGGRTGEMATDLVKKWQTVAEREDEQGAQKSASKTEKSSKHSSDHKKTDKSSKSEENQDHHHKHRSRDHSSHNGHEKSSKSKDSKKERPEEKKEPKPEKLKLAEGSSKDRKRKAPSEDEELDAQFGSFADCLGTVDPVDTRKKKKQKSTSPRMTVTSSTINASSSKPKGPRLPDLIDKKLPDSKDLGLSNLVADYKPLPRVEPKIQPIAPAKRPAPYDEASMFTSSRKDRTAVYSGRRTVTLSSVPSLFDSCIRVLMDNLDFIGETGGVPYNILKPVLERCTWRQLWTLEDYNPYLIEDTDELWKHHAQKDFRGKTPARGEETWRDLYIRCHDEREMKLKSLTASISQSMKEKQAPVRTTKLAYVDSMAKPPRNVQRAQLKNGTQVANRAHPSEARKIAAKASTSSAAENVRAPSNAVKKPKVAPLMAKTLSLLKMRRTTGYGFSSR